MMALYDKDSYMKMFEKRKEKEGFIKALANMVKKGRLTVEEAAEESEMTVSDFRSAAGLQSAQ